MRIRAIEKFRCGECREVHDDEDGARDCCMPRVWAIYQCPVCEKLHEEDEDAALDCCGVNAVSCPCCRRDHSNVSPAGLAVVIVGHCTTCNPFFTVEQQLLIEDAHQELTCKPLDLLR